MKRIIFDLDETLCTTHKNDYKNSAPINDVINKLKFYKNLGFTIVISTSRNMRTFDCSIGKINAFTLPTIVDWLNLNQIPYDEIHIGKPWCGLEGFYVDDRAIRPSEFLELNYNEIIKLISKK